jgi:outer membrane lipoprotein-sorting protein
MNKKIFFLIICLFCLVSLSACGKSIYVQDGESKLVMNGNGMAESDSLDTLLDRVKNVSNIRYDILSTDAKGTVITQKFWFKDKKMRMEADKTVTIFDQANQSMYIYTPAENTAIKMSLGLGQQTQESIIDEASGLDQYKPEVIGNEVIDGKNCLVIQYKWGGTITKQWLWKKYGLPVKIETDDGKAKSTVTYENFDFSVIPENMFELPVDVKITDMSNLPDLKDFKLPEIK